MVLLGITWIFGAFAVGPARLPFMYVFCILNSSQGFIIFLVRCLLYEETRNAWLILFRTGKIKKFRGKAYAGGTRSSDLQSSISDGKPNHRSSNYYAKRAPYKNSSPKNAQKTTVTSAPNETRPLLIKTEPDNLTDCNQAENKANHESEEGAKYLKYIDEPLTPIKSSSCP